jgi:hypothetical protein
MESLTLIFFKVILEDDDSVVLFFFINGYKEEIIDEDRRSATVVEVHGGLIASYYGRLVCLGMTVLIRHSDTNKLTNYSFFCLFLIFFWFSWIISSHFSSFF